MFQKKTPEFVKDCNEDNAFNIFEETLITCTRYCDLRTSRLTIHSLHLFGNDFWDLGSFLENFPDCESFWRKDSDAEVGPHKDLILIMVLEGFRLRCYLDDRSQPAERQASLWKELKGRLFDEGCL